VDVVRLRTLTVCTLLATLTTTTTASATERYVVRWGDTLTWIAQAHHTTLGKLARLNHIPMFGILQAGRVLSVPGHARSSASGHGSTRLTIHVVRPGETLTGIARAHGMSLSALARLNHRPPYATLLIGTHLRVPERLARRPLHVHAAHATPHTVWRGRYVVRAGDTLSGIARSYRVGLDRLAQANGISVNGLLLIGARLSVPRRSTPSPSPRPIGTSSVVGLIDHWSAHYGVDARLARAIAWQESGFNPTLTSATGAWGVMQIEPGTWVYVERQLIGESVPRTAGGDVRIGVAYLHSLLSEFGGDERLAVAAYYQGPAAVAQHGVFPGSQSYVANVLALRARV
jgi:LysM repeat protein